MTRAILLTLLLTGCAHTGPVADGITTEVALQAGATEANPLLAGGHPAALVASVVARGVVMESRRGKADCEHTAAWISGAGWAFAGNNAAIAIGGAAASAIALPAGILLALLIVDATEGSRGEWCHGYELTDYPCTLPLPEGITAATCVDGRLARTD